MWAQRGFYVGMLPLYAKKILPEEKSSHIEKIVENFHCVPQV